MYWDDKYGTHSVSTDVSVYLTFIWFGVVSVFITGGCLLTRCLIKKHLWKYQFHVKVPWRVFINYSSGGFIDLKSQ
jgi:hypothetical protein